MSYDVRKIREDFPILKRQVHGKPLIYLDNAATSQKPRQVIEAIDRYYRETNANIHRAVHRLSEEATAAYEGTREIARKFLNAGSTKEIIFTRGTTESINLVSQTLGRSLKPGDEVIITTLEHHSNIVPWQLICEQTGATLRAVPINEKGELVQEEYQKLLSGKTKIVAMGHVSNALGTINPVKAMTALAHEVGAKVILDGAQGVLHMAVDVRDLDCDFYAFSSHKVYGPTGVGVLYGKEALLETMPPYQGGGDMILTVTLEKSTWNDLPHKFEAGTPNIAGTIGMGEALKYVMELGLENIAMHETELLHYGNRVLADVPGLKLIGTAEQKAAIFSFVLEGVHPHDIGTIIDQEGVAIRTGHHCAQPVMEWFGIAATARASLGVYNTREELDALGDALHKVVKLFG